MFDADQQTDLEECLGCGEDVDTSFFKPLGENCGIGEKQLGLRSVTGFSVKTFQDLSRHFEADDVSFRLTVTMESPSSTCICRS